MNFLAYFKLNILMITMALFNPLNVIAQNNNERLCVLFEKDSQVIEISSDTDSTRFGFNIIKEGFETKESREDAKLKALEAYEKNPLIPYQYPEIYLSYTSFKKSSTYHSTDSFELCETTVSLNEFRKSEFIPPKMTGMSQIYLIQKTEKGIRVWAASSFE